jgi:hypothetical protein
MTTDMGYTPGAAGPREWIHHVVGWNELPRDVAPSAIERVVLFDLSMDASMPEVLRELPNVHSLSTDAHLLAFTPADVPKLAELHIGGTSELTLPAGPWPRLTSVEARDAVVNVADASHFPVLERLIVRTKGTKKVFAEIAKIASLRELQIGPVKDAAALTPVKIPSLTEVWFNTCAGIKKAEALVDLPKLARVKFWGCRDNGGALTKACKKLMARGVTVETELFA